MSPALLLDVGNTNIKAGLADETALLESFSLPTDNAATSDSLGLTLTAAVRQAGAEPKDIAAVIVSSVAPPLNPLLAAAAERYFGCEAAFVPGDIPVPLENRYARPHEVGADRLATSYAAVRLYDAPSLVVVDFGTATTFDCVRGNAFLGGLICPGLLTSLRALSRDTAKLPHIALEAPKDGLSIGRSTSECINQGFLYGFADMTEGVCARLAAHLGDKTRIVATGGFAKALSPLCPSFDDIRPDLLLEGLRLLGAGRAAA